MQSHQKQPSKNPQDSAQQADALHKRDEQVAVGVAAYGKPLAVAVIAIGLLASGYAVTETRQRKADEKASEAYAQAVALLKTQQRVPDASKSNPEDVKKKTTELKKAHQQFHQLSLDHPQAKAAGLALLYEARLLVELGKTKEALTVYETFLQTCRPQGHLCALGVLGKANAQELLGDSKQALETLEKSIAGQKQQPGNTLLRWHLVRLAHTLGLQEKARTHGAWLKEHAPNAWVSSQAQALVGLGQ